MSGNGDMADPIEVVDYDPNWVDTFQKLRSRMRSVIDKQLAAIEHVGSTSVPGLAAKPVIDIDVVIDSTEQLPEVIERLHSLGYVHEGDLGIQGREAFKAPPNLPSHHLYVVVAGSRPHTDHIVLRNHLRTHAEDAARYGELKKSLAERFRNDRAAYTEAKAAMVRELIDADGKDGVSRNAFVPMEWVEYDVLVEARGIVVERAKGTAHPEYDDWIYPLDYGHIPGTASPDGEELDVFIGSTSGGAVGLIIVRHDGQEEPKLLWNMNEEEIEAAVRFLNSSVDVLRVLRRSTV